MDNKIKHTHSAIRIGVDGGVFHGSHSGVGIYNYFLLLALVKDNNYELIIYSCKYALFPQHSRIQTKLPPDFMARSIVLSQLWRIFIPLYCFLDNIDVFFAGNGLTNIFQCKKTILVVHDFVYRFYPETMSIKGLWARRLMQSFWMKRADAVICNSNATASDLWGISQRAADAVIKPYSQLDASCINNYPRVAGLPDRYMLVVGTLEPRKNLASLVRAYDRYIDTYYPDVITSLVFVGRSGWKSSELLALVHRHPDRYLLLDYVPKEQLAFLYSQALCVWMPSLYEGFGIPLLEARILGCPIISADVPAMREAAGDAALYHQPTYDSILQMIDLLYKSNFDVLIQPDPDSVDWDWDTGAQTLMSVIKQVVNKP